MAGNEHTRRGPRRILELVAVLACAGVMVFVGSSLATSGNGHGYANGHAKPGHTTGPSGPSTKPKQNCKKHFRGNRKHRKCRKKHRGHGTLHAPGQQK